MSKSLAIALLQKGSNGAEILQILDTISTGMDDTDTAESAPTLDPIEF